MRTASRIPLLLGLVAASALLLAARQPAGAAPGGEDGARLVYSDAEGKAEVASDWSLSLTIQGTEQLQGFVRSLHPILSLDRVHIRATGRGSVADGKRKLENDEARAEGSYDDEAFAFDFDRRALPQDLATNKLEALMLALSSGRAYALSRTGEYRSEDANQDHNGEAMDHYLLGVTRLPERPLAAGESFDVEWKGERHEKGKHGHFAFKQHTKVESLEPVESVARGGGVRRATLVSDLEGELLAPEAEKNPQADESWTRCKGTTRVLLEIPSGRVLASSGCGKVEAYFRGTAEDGGKNEVRITFAVEGKNDWTWSDSAKRKGSWH